MSRSGIIERLGGFRTELENSKWKNVVSVSDQFRLLGLNSAYAILSRAHALAEFSV